MRAAIVIVGFFAALFASALALVTVGMVPAIVAGILLIGAIVVGFFVPRSALRGLLTIFVVVLVAAIGVAGWGAWSIAQALGGTDGEVDPPDQAALASVDAKLAAAEVDQGFRIELTMDELNAAVQEALASGDSHPVRAVEFFVVEPDISPERGVVGFEATFKSGGITATGELQVDIEAGKPVLGVRELDLGIFSLPGVAEGAASDMVDAIADFNAILADLDGELQDLRIGPDRVVAIGVQRGAPIAPDQVLDQLRSELGSLSFEVTLPPQRYEPGSDQPSVDGDRYVVSLGDSLAASVGVDDNGYGYVSKFHRHLTEVDGIEYGLRNFGVSGETSSSIFDSQLPAALEFIGANAVDYVTIDIGANDFLSHLTSGDCSSDLSSPTCLQRIDASFVRYRANLGEILDALAESAPDATLIVLTSYNPFSFGFASEVTFERDSADLTIRFNRIAEAAAIERGMLIADGYGAIVARALAMTHMADSEPDIHPNEDGYDSLTHALVEGLERGVISP